MTHDATPDTYFATAERAGNKQVLVTRGEFLPNPLVVALLASIPDLALVLNHHRQVVACNAGLLQAPGMPSPAGLLGRRPGEGQTVRIDAEGLGDRVALRVNNPMVMPEEVQKQIFQRSFSTKGGSGRGTGTHSVKLLTERYLGGEVSFISKAPEGTTFTVTLPKTRAR